MKKLADTFEQELLKFGDYKFFESNLWKRWKDYILKWRQKHLTEPKFPKLKKEDESLS